jgi:hypothetical protein
MNRVVKCLLFCALAGPTGAAQAQDFGYGYGGGWGWGGGFYNVMIDDQRPPYFALHPPVYYSYPVPRTYGYSPFAYPGCVPTPDLHLGLADPGAISNPYVPDSQSPVDPEDGPQLPGAEPTASRDRTASTRPLRIRNPFVETATAAAPLPADLPGLAGDPHGRVLVPRTVADSSR